MTVIVAARTKQGVAIAADTLTTAGWEKMHHEGSKLWRTDQFIIGGAGCVRAAQVIQHHTTWPKYRKDEDLHLEAFLVKSVVPAIKAAIETNGVLTTTAGVVRWDTSLIIAWDNNLAIIHGNGAVTIPRFGRCAIGSGSAEALGALSENGPWTVSQVTEAARRATITAVGCEGDIHHLTTWGEST